MKLHKLKTEMEYFFESFHGRKFFEIRKNDRDYKIGDEVELLEYDKKKGECTGAALQCRITYVTDYAQKPGYVVFGVEFL